MSQLKSSCISCSSLVTLLPNAKTTQRFAVQNAGDKKAQQFIWYDSIFSIPPNQWDSCFQKDDTLNSHALFAAIETAQLDGMKLFYLTYGSIDQISLAFPCFLYTSRLDVLAPPIVGKLATITRKLFPSFLQVKAFILGSPLAICKDSLGIKQLDGGLAQLPTQEVLRTLLNKAKQLNAHVILIKELNSQQISHFKAVRDFQLRILPSMPASKLTLCPDIPYSNRLRSPYRRRFQLRRKQIALLSKIEILSSTDNCSENLSELYHNVLEKSHTKFEILNPNFFREVPRRLNDKCFILAFKHPEVIAFALVIESEKAWHPIYIGLNYALRDKFSLYYNIFYQTIIEAEKNGIQQISLGQTAYQSKASLGAEFQELFLAFHPIASWMQVVLFLFGRMLFPTVTPPTQHVFKNCAF